MLSNSEIKSIVSESVKSASDNNSVLEQERVEALARYNGELYGDEVDGRSKVVTTEFRDAVEWASSQILEVFFGGEKTVEFSPRTADDVDIAKVATDHIDYILNTENNSFVIFNQWIKDALMNKIGVVKGFYEKTEKKGLPEILENLSDGQFIIVSEDENVEIIEHTENEVHQSYTAAEGEEVVATITTHDVKYRKLIDDSGIRIEPIPLDEFIVSDDAKFCSRTGGVDSTLIGHRRKYTQSDLIAMGFDPAKVEALKNADDTTFESDNRHPYSTNTQNEDTVDPSTREVWIVEAYMNIDRDEDGFAELCRVIIGDFNGDGEILKIEEWDMQPFCVITPILMQHVLAGVSMYDLIIQLQHAKTSITRQVMNNLYLSNNPRHVIKEGVVNLDDVLNSDIAHPIRVTADNAVSTHAIPFTAMNSLPILDHIDRMAEERTGSSRQSQGLNPDALQSTSPDVAMQNESASSQKLALWTRTMAETGVKYLFKLMLHLAKRYEPNDKIIQLTDANFQEVNASEYPTEMNVIINVGVGSASKRAKLSFLSQIMSEQKAVIAQLGPTNEFVNLKHYQTTMQEILRTGGVKGAKGYFGDPDKAMAALSEAKQKQGPSADVMKAEAEIKLKQQKLQADIQLEQEKFQFESQLKMKELEAEIALKQIKQITTNGEGSTELRFPDGNL